MTLRFSGRLDWSPGENALAKAQRWLPDAGVPVLDLTEANPTAVGLTSEPELEALGEALRQAARAPYAPDPRGDAVARRAVADAYAAGGHLASGGGRAPVAPAALAERLLLTASSSESYSFIWKLLCDPGDTVLVPEPSYPLFDYLARLEGVTTRPYRLTHDGSRTGLWQLDLASVDAALASATTRVAALVIVSPNNPTGSVSTGDDLAALDRRANDGGFALVSDEVFADYLVRPGPGQVTFVAGRPTETLTFSLGGLSKSCGLPQLKLGWIAVGGPAADAAKAMAHLELIADTYLSVGTPVQVALPELLRLGATRRRSIAARLAENRNTLLELTQRGSPLSVLKAEGGWSAIVRLPAIRTDEEWALAFLADGVLVHPGYFFDLRDATCVVLSLLPRPEVFQEGVRRLAARVASYLAA